MKKISLLLLMALILMFFQSCSTQTSALNDLRELSADIEREGSTYSVHDWLKTKSRYQSIDHQLSKYTWTDAQREEIGNLKGKCLKNFAKGVMENLSDKISGAASELKGFLNVITESSENK